VKNPNECAKTLAECYYEGNEGGNSKRNRDYGNAEANTIFFVPRKILRNRESGRLSRLRKADYIRKLEKLVSDCKTQIQRLNNIVEYREEEIKDLIQKNNFLLSLMQQTLHSAVVFSARQGNEGNLNEQHEVNRESVQPTVSTTVITTPP